MKEDCSVKYGLMDRKGNQLTLEENINREEGPWNDCSYSLSKDKDNRLFLVRTLEEASHALSNHTPWYNSTPYRPSHGEIDMRGVRIVRIIYKVVIEPIEELEINIKRPLLLEMDK
jgi:hypothetical protein